MGRQYGPTAHREGLIVAVRLVQGLLSLQRGTPTLWRVTPTIISPFCLINECREKPRTSLEVLNVISTNRPIIIASDITGSTSS